MNVVLIILLAFVALVIYSNIPKPKPGMQYWNVITLNPFVNPPECPRECKMFSLDTVDATPSILMDSLPDKSRCGYQEDTIVYPCSSKCCA